MHLPDHVTSPRPRTRAPHPRQRATAIAALISVMLTAATRTDAQPGGAVARPGAPSSASYVVEVSAFTMTPANPKPGDNVSLQLTLRNRGTTNASNVPWLIGLQGGSQMVGQGTLALAAGATQTVTATWRAVAGAQSALGTIAPPGANTMINTATPAQKAKDLTFNVASVSASTASELETRVIDWDKAKVAGMRYTAGIQSGGAMCSIGLEPIRTDGQILFSGGRRSATFAAPGGTAGQVAAFIQCAGPVGGRANPEFFDFTLRNGWRVQRVDITSPRASSSSAGLSSSQGTGWQVVQRPQAGDARPYIKLSMFADLQSEIVVLVRVEIVGPRGTDPYQ